ncbi:helix-turn-helix domain-containing protein, partial [Streptomyces formicae]
MDGQVHQAGAVGPDRRRARGRHVTYPATTTDRPLLAFGQRLRELRVSSGLSLTELGARVNYTPSWLSKLENGRPPTPEAARILDTVLGAEGALSELALGQARLAWEGSRPRHLPLADPHFSGRREERR